MSTAPQLLTIRGMSCAGCVRTVESTLSELPGVTSASVNFASQTAAVLGEFSTDTLIVAVNSAGYEAEPYQPVSIEIKEQEVRSELQASLIRSLIALAGGGLLMTDMYLAWLPGLDHRVFWLCSGMGILAIMMLSGGHFFRGALKALRNGTVIMDSLISLGTGTAWLFSMLVIVFPDWVPADSRHQFFEAALFVIGFVNLGKALETHARAKASLAIQKLFDLTPKFVTRISGSDEEMIPLELVVPGDELRVRPGESLPADGVVLTGISSVDAAMLTGESASVVVRPGALVHAGTQNIDGSLTIRAQSVGSDTLLGDMIRLVTEAQNSKPAIANLVDKISAIFVPVVVVLAVLTAFAWLLLGPEPQVSFALVTAMSVLIIACPCALGLAIPMSVIVGLGRAANQGLLIRNSEVLQTTTRLDVVVVDKTGTLTLGQPRVAEIHGIDDIGLGIAAALEANSEHPLGRAIHQYCLEAGAAPVTLQEFKNHAGGGVLANYENDLVLLGSEQFLRSKGIENIPEGKGTTAYLARGQRIIGAFFLEDQLRAEAIDTVSQLKGAGIDVVMLSGDCPDVVAQVAAQVGISEARSNCLPEDKLGYIKKLQSEGLIVGMAGDGINDAAALAQADVGFAMVSGTDIAKESADITLVTGSLRGIFQSLKLSRQIVANIHQNLTAAFAYNLLLIPVAAGVLYPHFGLLMHPGLAGLAMALSSVSVVMNASRLRFA